ncbi:MAG: hypothetical protein R3E98_20370 [Gemmatimonadota bacterium]
MDVEKLLEQLADTDHFVVCRALKTLRALSAPSAEVVDRVLALLASPVIAVEQNALDTLASFRHRALHVHSRIVGQLARRIGDGRGCDYSCCGYAAYYAPVERYIATLLAIADRERIEWALTADVEYLEKESIHEIRFLVAEF